MVLMVTLVSQDSTDSPGGLEAPGRRAPRGTQDFKDSLASVATRDPRERWVPPDTMVLMVVLETPGTPGPREHAERREARDHPDRTVSRASKGLRAQRDRRERKEIR